MGTDLKNLCDYYGMWQSVREPTRNEYLLDLVLTDIQNTTAAIMPYVADHKGVWIKLPFPEVLETSFDREVWHLASADWKRLKQVLLDIDWLPFNDGTAEDALAFFLEILWYLLVKHVPRRKIRVTKSSHPWLNDRSKDAIRRKNLAEGSESFEAERRKYMQILAEERARHVQFLRTNLLLYPNVLNSGGV